MESTQSRKWFLIITAFPHQPNMCAKTNSSRTVSLITPQLIPFPSIHRRQLPPYARSEGSTPSSADRCWTQKQCNKLASKIKCAVTHGEYGCDGTSNSQETNWHVMTAATSSLKTWLKPSRTIIDRLNNQLMINMMDFLLLNTPPTSGLSRILQDLSLFEWLVIQHQGRTLFNSQLNEYHLVANHTVYTNMTKGSWHSKRTPEEEAQVIWIADAEHYLAVCVTGYASSCENF